MRQPTSTVEKSHAVYLHGETSSQIEWHAFSTSMLTNNHVVEASQGKAFFCTITVCQQHHKIKPHGNCKKSYCKINRACGASEKEG